MQVANRRGVSLMEVLISIFVILFGLLGVASLLPIGRHEMTVGLHADRAGDCGRAALREVQVRQMLEPFRMADDGTGQLVPLLLSNHAGFAAAMANTDVNALLPPFAIDPLGVVQYGGSNDKFPLSSTTGLPRVTLRVNPPFSSGSIPAIQWMSQAYADRIFTWHDDLNIDYSGERTLRSRPTFRMDDGNIISDLSAVPAGRTVLTADMEGKYSWMLTVSPVISENLNVLNRQKKLYSVSAVVFNSRTFTTDSEKCFNVLFPGTGTAIGGGDVKLYSLAEAPEIKPREWIMLGLPNSSVFNPPQYAFVKWYRVIAADDEAKQETINSKTVWTRQVTLAGPDWDVGVNGVEAAVVPGVIGVYTETVELDR